MPSPVDASRRVALEARGGDPPVVTPETPGTRRHRTGTASADGPSPAIGYATSNNG
ncbi:hypothetical protein [Halopiger djelfimassiliensis]|uniref:hypothetical protein n=1 Tax=Halopiger djelfimassiliensis TaxID=1293047 RepID=UPI000AE3F491|nr:hypothetical protein [Halopiger djelfimassiliensis]